MIQIDHLPFRPAGQWHANTRREHLCETCGQTTVWARFSREHRDRYYCPVCVAQDLKGVGYHVNKHNRAGVMLLNICADPNKDIDTPIGRQWVLAKQAAYANQPGAFEREYMNNHDTGTQARIYPDFNIKDHLNPDLVFNPSELLYMGFDWGLTHPAVVFAQWYGEKLHVLLEILGFDTPIHHFRDEVIRLLKDRFFPSWGMNTVQPGPLVIESLQRDEPVKLKCVGDYAGNQRGHSQVSDLQFMYSAGFNIQTRFSYPIRRIEKVRTLLPIGNDGLPRLFLKGETFQVRGNAHAKPLDKSQPGTLLQGFLGGYKFKTDRHGILSMTKHGPQVDKGGDDVSSHLQDALSEIVEHSLNLSRPDTKELRHPMEGRGSFFNLRDKRKENIEQLYDHLEAFYNDPQRFAQMR